MKVTFERDGDQYVCFRTTIPITEGKVTVQAGDWAIWRNQVLIKMSHEQFVAEFKPFIPTLQ